MVPKICAVEDCGGNRRALGYCNRHYKHFKKYGDPTLGKTLDRHIPAIDRFWQKVAKRGPQDCWEWMAFRDQDGYGRFTDDAGKGGRRTTIRAHRWIYEYLNGTLSDGYVMDHLCRNRGCVNPAHLEPVTNQENLDRGWGRRLSNGMTTKCINGHEYTPDNTYTNPQGKKSCRVCNAKSKARYKQRKKAA